MVSGNIRSEIYLLRYIYVKGTRYLYSPFSRVFLPILLLGVEGLLRKLFVCLFVCNRGDTILCSRQAPGNKRACLFVIQIEIQAVQCALSV